jgi:hypothetical protein
VGECLCFGNAFANFLPQKVLSLHFQIKIVIVTEWGVHIKDSMIEGVTVSKHMYCSKEMAIHQKDIGGEQR